MSNYPPYAYPPGQYQPPYPPGPNRHEGLAVASLVLGILGAVFCWTVLTAWLAIILGVLATVFGAIGHRPTKGKWGLALGIVSIGVSILAYAVFAHDVHSAVKNVDSAYSSAVAQLPTDLPTLPGDDASGDVTVLTCTITDGYISGTVQIDNSGPDLASYQMTLDVLDANYMDIAALPVGQSDVPGGGSVNVDYSGSADGGATNGDCTAQPDPSIGVIRTPE